MAETTLQRHVDKKCVATGLQDWGGGPSFKEGGPEGVFQL